MVTQYPHILKFILVTGSTEGEDEKGNTIIVPGTTATIELKCRFEPSSSGSYIPSTDGQQLVYSWIVYILAGQVDIPNGIEIQGFNNAELIASGTIKRFSKGQMNARAWV